MRDFGIWDGSGVKLGVLPSMRRTNWFMCMSSADWCILQQFYTKKQLSWWVKVCANSAAMELDCTSRFGVFFEATRRELLFSRRVRKGPCQNVLSCRALIACCHCTRLHFSLPYCFYTAQLIGLISSLQTVHTEANQPLCCSYSHHKSPFFILRKVKWTENTPYCPKMLSFNCDKIRSCLF